MIAPFFSFFVTAFANENPSFKFDCPFFLKWSADWQTCMVQWNTFYGLFIILVVIGIIVSAVLVVLWKVYRKKTGQDL